MALLKFCTSAMLRKNRDRNAGLQTSFSTLEYRSQLSGKHLNGVPVTPGILGLSDSRLKATLKQPNYFHIFISFKIFHGTQQRLKIGSEQNQQMNPHQNRSGAAKELERCGMPSAFWGKSFQLLPDSSTPGSCRSAEQSQHLPGCENQP